MFKGRVQIYTNRNGRENKIDREFDNPEEFNQFLKENSINTQGIHDEMNMSLNNWARLQDFFENMIDRRLHDIGREFEPLGMESWETPANDVVDLSKYEQEARRLEEEKRNKEYRKSMLENTMEKLKEYKKKFQDEGKQDLVKQIDEDMKKVEDERKQLDKSDNKQKWKK